jgi:hypothetical protein
MHFPQPRASAANPRHGNCPSMDTLRIGSPRAIPSDTRRASRAAGPEISLYDLAGVMLDIPRRFASLVQILHQQLQQRRWARPVILPRHDRR